MTISEADGLTILALAAPFLVAATALLGMWLTTVLERWEDRRSAQRAVPGE